MQPQPLAPLPPPLMERQRPRLRGQVGRRNITAATSLCSLPTRTGLCTPWLQQHRRRPKPYLTLRRRRLLVGKAFAVKPVHPQHEPPKNACLSSGCTK